MSHENRPDWQLPPGVTRALWDYVHCPAIADDYDVCFAENRLFKFDEQVVMREFEARGLGKGSLIADLGCGTGRALVLLARRGFRGLAVDLSDRMLANVRRKICRDRLPIQCLRANLVELDAIADDCVDGALSLFSTLGMIRGRAYRQRALEHACRILKPGAALVLHVHNYWYNLYDPGGPWWLLRNMLRAAVIRDIEAGDKFFDYHGIPNMFLHVFTLRELVCALRRAGFRLCQIVPLDPRRHRALPWSWFLGRLRANGWITVSEKRRSSG